MAEAYWGLVGVMVAMAESGTKDGNPRKAPRGNRWEEEPTCSFALLSDIWQKVLSFVNCGSSLPNKMAIRLWESFRHVCL
jgi:hypothetical protein